MDEHEFKNAINRDWTDHTILIAFADYLEERGLVLAQGLRWVIAGGWVPGVYNSQWWWGCSDAIGWPKLDRDIESLRRPFARHCQLPLRAKKIKSEMKADAKRNGRFGRPDKYVSKWKEWYRGQFFPSDCYLEASREYLLPEYEHLRSEVAHV